MTINFLITEYVAVRILQTLNYVAVMEYVIAELITFTAVSNFNRTSVAMKYTLSHHEVPVN
jgi:ACR3 family arsenite efflux pump ArsB